jgi:hypothetical protein
LEADGMKNGGFRGARQRLRSWEIWWREFVQGVVVEEGVRSEYMSFSLVEWVREAIFGRRGRNYLRAGGGAFWGGFFDGFFNGSKMAKSHGLKSRLCGYLKKRSIFGVRALERAHFFRVECMEEEARGLCGYPERSHRKGETRGFFDI